MIYIDLRVASLIDEVEVILTPSAFTLFVVGKVMGDCFFNRLLIGGVVVGLQENNGASQPFLEPGFKL